MIDFSTARATIARLDKNSRKVSTPTGDGQMVWRVWGAGAPLVLVHGGHGSWTHWAKNIEALAQTHTVIAADVPGHGDSAMPHLPFTAESLACDLAIGISAILGTAPFKIMAFSFGTMLAGQVGVLLNAQVKKLLLVAPNGLKLRRGEQEEMTRWRELKDEAEILAAHRRNLGIQMIADPSRIDELSLYIHHENTRRTHLRARWLARTDALLVCLARIAAPIDCIWGGRDSTVGTYFDERKALFAKERPDTVIEILPQGGHWVQYELADEFNPLALTLLQV